MSPEEAVSLIINANLSKHAYNTLRTNDLKHNHYLYPSYKKVHILQNMSTATFIFL